MVQEGSWGSRGREEVSPGVSAGGQMSAAVACWTRKDIWVELLPLSVGCDYSLVLSEPWFLSL